jgi:hypothetical protein
VLKNNAFESKNYITITFPGDDDGDDDDAVLNFFGRG